MIARLTGLWRHPDFLKLWAGQTVSLVGSQITLLALPLVAALVLRATPLQMGILTAALATPALLFGLPAGAWIDRLPRRPILVDADLGRFALLGAIPLAYLMGILRLELLYVVAFLIGTFTLLFDVAYQSFLPSLLAREELVEGNSKLEMSRSAANLVGLGLAGVLVQLVTAPVAIAVDACSFLVSALTLGFVRAQEPHPSARDKSKRIWSEIGEGLRLVFGAPTLRALTGSRATLTFFNSMLEAVFVLYLVRQIGIAPALLGLIWTVGSLGFLVGAALAGRVTRRIGSGAALGCRSHQSAGWLKQQSTAPGSGNTVRR